MSGHVASSSSTTRPCRSCAGWLPSFATPADVRDGIATIKQHDDESEREIDPEHFGALLAYTDGP